MGILATAGLRWYFCNKAGLWVDGGHDGRTWHSGRMEN